MPTLVSDPQATIDPALQSSCIDVTVRFSFFVNEEGQVEDLKVLSDGHPPGCAEYASSAVGQWRYEPARDVEGAAVRAPMSVAFEIREVPDDP
jgi:hypothetical protein